MGTTDGIEVRTDSIGDAVLMKDASSNSGNLAAAPGASATERVLAEDWAGPAAGPAHVFGPGLAQGPGASADKPARPMRVSDTGPFLFLSLFLLLLAFFILLNAISTLEETKSRAVLSSVAATFQSKVVPDRQAEILISTLGPAPRPEDVTDDLERLWATAVPIAQIEVLSPGRVLQLSMPVTQVFVGGQAAVRADRRDLLRATAFALASRLPGLTVQLRMTVPVEEMSVISSRTDPDDRPDEPVLSIQEALSDTELRGEVLARIEAGIEAGTASIPGLSAAGPADGSDAAGPNTAEQGTAEQESAQSEPDEPAGAPDVETGGTAQRADGLVEQLDPITGQTVFIEGAENDPGGTAADALDPRYLPFGRAAAFAAALVDGGAPPDGVSVGVAEGQSGLLRLRFDIVDRDRAHVTFSQLAEEAVERGEISALPPAGEPSNIEIPRAATPFLTEDDAQAEAPGGAGDGSGVEGAEP
ncbi:MAG: hypothetical protein QNJ84_13190 [Alphaproteobacteria bacterium]|nr:hypothetical protein [Alphaproteobacteria bacterium]